MSSTVPEQVYTMFLQGYRVYKGESRMWWEIDGQLAFPVKPGVFDADAFVERWLCIDSPTQ